MGNSIQYFRQLETGYIQDTIVPESRVDPTKPTIDLVASEPRNWQTLFSTTSWSHFCVYRFGLIAQQVSFSVFHHLDAKDGHPGDGILDISALTPHEIESVFEKLHGTEEGADEALGRIKSSIMRHRQVLDNITVVKVGPTWWGVRENGQVMSLSGDEISAAVQLQAALNPLGQVRVVVDKRYFTGLVENDLNVDRTGIWAASQYTASLAGTGGLGVYDTSASLTALPFQTRLSEWDPSMIENIVMVAALVSAVIAVVGFSKRGSGGPVPVQAVGGRGMLTGRSFEVPQQVMAILESLHGRREDIPAVYVGGTASTPAPISAGRARLPVSYTLDPWLTPERIGSVIAGRRLENDGVSFRIIADQVAVYRDLRSPSARREGFVILRVDDPLTLIPLESVRHAVRCDRTELLKDKKGNVIWEVSPMRSNSKHYDLVGIRIRSTTGEINIELPWVDLWREGPLDRHYSDGWSRQLMPENWNGSWNFNWSGREAFAARLIERQDLLRMHVTSKQQLNATGVIAAAIVDPLFDAGAVSQLSQVLVLGGRPALRSLTSRVADRLRRPEAQRMDYDWFLGPDVPFRLNTRLLEGIEADILEVHGLYPSINSPNILYPHNNAPSRTGRK